MNRYLCITKSFLLLGGLLFLASCAKNDNVDQLKAPDKAKEIPNSLHIAFETPDWKRQIDCSQLDLYPNRVAAYYPERNIWDGPTLIDDVVWVGARSASTQNYFMLSYPKTVEALENPDNLRRYPVAEFGTITGPFQYAMELPLDERLNKSGQWLASRAGESTSEFTEITEIKRVGTEEPDGRNTIYSYAIYQIKGRYAFKSLLETFTAEGALSAAVEADDKPVTGSFHLKVRVRID